MQNSDRLAMEQQDYVIGLRRELHRIPETRFETKGTRDVILREIKYLASSCLGTCRFGIPRESKGGIVFDIDVPGCTDRILFRADFDALLIEEDTGLEFSSANKGVSHACGHDAHVAMLMGFLKSVSDGKLVPVHNLRIVFQDGEENPGVPPETESGGEILVREGVTESVSYVYTLHVLVDNNSRNGVFISRGGAMLANTGRICMKINSTGGHAGMPDTGVNALRVVRNVMDRLDLLRLEIAGSIGDVALEPVILNAGKSSNVMPSGAEMWYSFRSLIPREQHLEISNRIVSEIKKTASDMNAEIDAVSMPGAPLLVNDHDEFKRVFKLLNVNGQKAVEAPPMLGGEDFAHYLYRVPGVVFWLDAGQEGTGKQHTPKFNPDENVLWKGVHFWMLLAV